MSNYRDRIWLQEYEEIEDPMGITKEWNDDKRLPCRKCSIDAEGQAEFEQIGYSEVQNYFQFPYKIDLSLSDNRFREVLRDGSSKYYEIIKPPEYLGGIKPVTKVYVREVQEEDGG